MPRAPRRSKIVIPKEILENVCRFCLMSNRTLYSIFDISICQKGTSNNTVRIKMVDVIKIFCNIRIKPEDNKPKNTCVTCINSIKEFYKFFKGLKENDYTLSNVTCGTSSGDSNDMINSLIEKQNEDIESKEFLIEIKDNILNYSEINNDMITIIKHTDVVVKNEENSTEIPTEVVESKEVVKNEENQLDDNNKLEDSNSIEDKDDTCLQGQETCDSSDDDYFLGDLKREAQNCNSKKLLKKVLAKGCRYKGKKVKTKFKEGERFVCQFCSENFLDIHSTISHFEESHPNEGQCLICSKEIHKYMKFHISNHAEESTSCQSCRIYFGKQELLEDHYVKFDHTSTRCHLCNKKFLTKSKRNFHMKVVHYNTVKPFCCEVCGKQFRYMPNMERHRRNHIIPQRFMCSHCGEKYSTNNALQRHILKIHEGKVIDKKTGEKVPYVPKPMGRRRGAGGAGKYLSIKCEYCETVVTSRNGYARHLETHPEFMDYKCRFCENQYPTRALLREHLEEIHNRHLCQVCGKKFLHGYLLERHYAMYHKELGITAPVKDVALYECEMCHNKFRSRPSLADHMRVHTGEKPFKCKVCGKGFKQKAHLTIHQIQHTGERPNKCHICGKCFTFKWTLESHTRIHTGEKPFSCPYCGNCYRDTTLLLKHKKKDHPDKLITTKRGKIAKPRNNVSNNADNNISENVERGALNDSSINCVSNSISNEEVSQHSPSNKSFSLPVN